jgi:biotin transport system substrate-specific component
MTTRSLETPVSLSDVRTNALAKDAALVVGASLLMAVCAHVAVPLAFSPVPITLQTFGLLIIAFTLGSRRALAAMMLYLIEGAAGLPVFSPSGLGGVAQLLGATGGFLFAYPAAAFVAGMIARPQVSAKAKFISAAVCAEFVLFTGGLLWFMVLTGTGFRNALSLTVLPFIPGEVLKIAAACALAAVFQRRFSRQ